jgi:hypothetical protein
VKFTEAYEKEGPSSITPWFIPLIVKVVPYGIQHMLPYPSRISSETWEKSQTQNRQISTKRAILKQLEKKQRILFLDKTHYMHNIL